MAARSKGSEDGVKLALHQNTLVIGRAACLKSSHKGESPRCAFDTAPDLG